MYMTTALTPQFADTDMQGHVNFLKYTRNGSTASGPRSTAKSTDPQFQPARHGRLKDGNDVP